MMPRSWMVYAGQLIGRLVIFPLLGGKVICVYMLLHMKTRGVFGSRDTQILNAKSSRSQN